MEVKTFYANFCPPRPNEVKGEHLNICHILLSASLHQKFLNISHFIGKLFTCTICTGMLASLAAFFSMWASSTNILDGHINLPIWGTPASSQIYIDPRPHNPLSTTRFYIIMWTLPVHKVVALNTRERSSKVEVISLEKKIWLRHLADNHYSWRRRCKV